MRISPQIVRLDCCTESNIYVVKTAPLEYVLIDTGVPGLADRIVIELRNMDIQPKLIKHIFLTHYEEDHIGNAKQLQFMTGATLWADAEEIPYILKKKRRPGSSLIQDLRLKYEVPFEIKPIEPGQTWCNGQLSAVRTPGRTPGHTCFLFEIYLFAGEIIQTENGHKIYPKDKLNWSSVEAHRSLGRLEETVEYSMILPGHGAPIEKWIINPYALEEEASFQ